MTRWFKNIKTGCEFEISDEAMMKRLAADPTTYTEIQPPRADEPVVESDTRADDGAQTDDAPKAKGRARK